MTRLICARCRYECQTELQRVICPRCASIIDTPLELPEAPEPLELEQSQTLPAPSQFTPQNATQYAPRYEDGLELGDVTGSDVPGEVLDLPESSQMLRSYNPAFDEACSEPWSEDEPVFEESAKSIKTVEKPLSFSPQRVIKLSEPKSGPLNTEPMFFVPKERLAMLQGRSWKGPGIVAAIALAGFGLYSLQGRLSPSPPPVAARKISTTPTPGPSRLSPAPAVQPTVIAAANIPASKELNSRPSPVPAKSRKPSEDLAKSDTKTEKKAEAEPKKEPKKNDRATDSEQAQGDGRLTVQVASFPSEQEAKERVGYLKSVGVPAQIVRADLGKRGIYFRVMTGRFMKPDDARKYGQQLLSKGKVQEFVVARL